VEKLSLENRPYNLSSEMIGLSTCFKNCQLFHFYHYVCNSININVYPLSLSLSLSVYINTHTHTQSKVCSCMFGLYTFPHHRTYFSLEDFPREVTDVWKWRTQTWNDRYLETHYTVQTDFFAVQHPGTRNCLPNNNGFCCRDIIVRASRICARNLHQLFFIKVSSGKIFF
jgi:hypothetical protein